ncbi:MAG: hypothetical protein ACYS0D_04015, partial [Planctomycetota bacterium]
CTRQGDAWGGGQELLAADAAPHDHFGFSVAVDGDTAVVGAPNKGNAGEFVPGLGAAYVFRYDGSTWVQEQKLTDPEGQMGDSFGWSVSVSGDVIVVGANFADAYAGVAFVYRYDGGSWVQESRIARPAGGENYFATALAVSGNAIVVGNYLHTANGPDAGAAYVFRDNGSEWALEQLLVAPEGQPGDNLGWSVAIAGDLIVAGAPFDDDTGVTSGSAYVFRYDGASWTAESKLLAQDGSAGDKFGLTVAVDDGIVLAGAPYWDEPNLILPDFGATYAFSYSAGNWSQEARILDPGGWIADQFGWSVAISNQTAIMGAISDDAELILNSGNSLIFERDPLPGCPADLDGDGTVSTSDLLELLGQWGGHPAGPPDLDGDGTVGTGDLLILLGAWGPC